MSLIDLDTYYIKSVGSLHSLEHVANREPSVVQLNLEEAIKTKTGITKDFGPLIASINTRPAEDIRTTTVVIEESKTTSSSDNELELDLFNDDLACIICKGMDVAARNCLLECSDCHSLYHQECHRPPVATFDSDGTWTCQNCKDASKKLKKSTPESSPLNGTLSQTNIKPILKNSPPHLQRPSNTSTSSSYKSSSSKSSNSLTVSKSSKSSGKSSSAGSNSKHLVTPNINIISADKRLQIMKKKAAKLHEKRKQLPR